MSIRKGNDIIASTPAVDTVPQQGPANVITSGGVYAALQEYGNWSHHISNCITEIPQDIKLELNNGTLTLKAGSKVYVPNGAGVFDEITTTQDFIMGQWGSVTGKGMVLRLPDGNIIPELFNNIYSGNTAPSGSTYMWWYDTANNMVKTTSNGGSTWSNLRSLPLCTITVANGLVTSIDQVFNGFGYIGSTVFALPGVKALIPDGRNDDGTLKNIDLTLTEVKTTTTTSDIYYGYIGIASHGGWVGPSDIISYNSNENHVYYSGSYQEWVIVGGVSVSSGKITFLDTNTTFHAVDYNDTEYMAHQSMPSNRYFDLTVGGSGASYIAPADGYFVVAITDSGYAELTTTTTSSTASFVGGWARAFIPVKKGTVMTLYYGNVGTWKLFRFYYAQGVYNV